MMAEVETNEDRICEEGFMLRCWQTFIPSVAPKFIDLTETPRKSVWFRLDQNKVHVVPQVPEEDNDYSNLYITEEEQEATRLEMIESVNYFRHVFLLERRPKGSTITRPTGEVSTIGLEWRIWPDGRFERREEIHRVVMGDFFFGGGTDISLARNCEPISKIAEQLARKRAARVVRALKESTSSNKSQDVTSRCRKHDLGRWMGISSWMESITLLRQG